MGEAPECPHGTRVYVSQMSRIGSGLWHAWGCPESACNGAKNTEDAGLIFMNEPKE